MSPVATIGGGRILDNSPVKHRRSDKSAVSRLSSLASGDTTEVIHELVRAKGARGMDLTELSRAVNLATDELLQGLDGSEVVSAGPERLLSKAAFDSLCEQALAGIARFHEANPGRQGQPLAEFRANLEAGVDDPVFRFLVEYLVEQGLVQTDKSIVRLQDFDPLGTLDATEKKIAGEIATAFASGGLKPPELDEVLQGNPQRKRLYRLLADTGELIPLHNTGINRVLVFHRRCIDEMVRKLEHAYPGSTTFSVAEARKLLDTTRKFAIPLLEYLDSRRVTIRIGDTRKLNPGRNDLGSE